MQQIFFILLIQEKRCVIKIDFILFIYLFVTNLSVMVIINMNKFDKSPSTMTNKLLKK